MNKQKRNIYISITISIIIMFFTFLFIGCTSSEPPVYPPDYSNIDIDVEFNYKQPVFYFGDIVQDNGSVNKSKTVVWTMEVTNKGDEMEEIHFDVVDVPKELILSSTEFKIRHDYHHNLTDFDGNITYTQEFVWDYVDREFDIKWNTFKVEAKSKMEFSFLIIFNEADEWTYSPDTTYAGVFEISYRVKEKNIYYKEIYETFVVRT